MLTISPSALTVILGWMASVRAARILPSEPTAAAPNSVYILTMALPSSESAADTDSVELEMADTPSVKEPGAAVKVEPFSSLQAFTMASWKASRLMEQEANSSSSTATL